MSINLRLRIVVGLLFCFSLVTVDSWLVAVESNERETPLVRAVASCRSAVVNLRGRKKVVRENSPISRDIKQVNGMGTGVIIDSRGYILTNYHVVQDVEQIQVTTSEREKTIGRLIAHDPETDLALLKIDLDRDLPTIPVGTSSDLMLAETVAAVGNAYGYEHTVTVGIISQLGRTVQVNDEQIYRNLIQTDAPINPGNSGGPLLNLDGKMIGINVAVRIGAQGIAFAIPANDAMETAAKLMEKYVTESSGVAHGITAVTRFENHRPCLTVSHVAPESPASQAGIHEGDRIHKVNGQVVERSLDLYSALVQSKPDSKLDLELQRGASRSKISVKLDRNANAKTNDSAWQLLGIHVQPATADEIRGLHPNYENGLKILDVRDDSPAELEGILPGDILVAMHGWKTESMENLRYILEKSDIRSRDNFMFYILREKESFWGKLRVASQIR